MFTINTGKQKTRRELINSINRKVKRMSRGALLAFKDVAKNGAGVVEVRFHEDTIVYNRNLDLPAISISDRKTENTGGLTINRINTRSQFALEGGCFCNTPRSFFGRIKTIFVFAKWVFFK